MLRVFSRYVAVQLVAYVFDMGTFVLLGLAGVQPVAANVASKLVAGAFAFISHRRFTFGVHRQRDGGAQLAKYAVLLAVNIPLSSALLALLLRWIPFPIPAKLLADAIGIVLTFALSRHLVFRVSKGA